MCGRYTHRRQEITFEDIAGQTISQQVAPRYNIAPSQDVPVCRINRDGIPEIRDVRWGLVPGWSNDFKPNEGIINARAETVRVKPSFRGPFRNRRCLIPADGYYEWQARGGSKQPYFIRLNGDHPFAFAGLWDLWVGRGDSAVESCAIITTTANDTLASIHNRMPVIIARKYYDRWLDPEFTDADGLEELLGPYPEEAMVAHPVSRFVNNPRNDDERCTAPSADNNDPGRVITA